MKTSCCVTQIIISLFDKHINMLKLDSFELTAMGESAGMLMTSLLDTLGEKHR